MAVGLVLLNIADVVYSHFTRDTLANERPSDYLYFQRGLGKPCSRAINAWCRRSTGDPHLA